VSIMRAGCWPDTIGSAAERSVFACFDDAHQYHGMFCKLAAFQRWMKELH